MASHASAAYRGDPGGHGISGRKTTNVSGELLQVSKPPALPKSLKAGLLSPSLIAFLGNTEADVLLVTIQQTSAALGDT